MSGETVGLVLRGVHGIEFRDKAVLLVLAETCKTDSDASWTGVRTIAQMLNVGQRQVRESLARLKAMGWIHQDPKSGHGPGNPSKFTIDFEAMREPAHVYRRTKKASGVAELVVAKAPPAGRNQAPHAGRIDEAAKRPVDASKAPHFDGKAPHGDTVMRPTEVNEPSTSIRTRFEPRSPTTQPETREVRIRKRPGYGNQVEIQEAAELLGLWPAPKGWGWEELHRECCKRINEQWKGAT